MEQNDGLDQIPPLLRTDSVLLRVPEKIGQERGIGQFFTGND